MTIRYAALAAIILISTCSFARTGPEFAPWDADVLVADGQMSGTRHDHDHGGSSLFGGIQGGAFLMIRFFQVFISPQDGPSCRYRPVCSVYGRSAVEKYGALAGALMAGDRILRCNPSGKPGPDPLPVFEGK